MTKRILVVSNFFYPEITPRAFRTRELVKKFCEKGYKVDLVLPNKTIYKKEDFSISNLNIYYGSSKLKRKSLNNAELQKGENDYLRKAKNLLRGIYYYFFPRQIYQTFDFGILKLLIKMKNKYDIVLAIGQPTSIPITVGISKLLNPNYKKAKFLGEFSDPLFAGKIWSVFPINWLWGYFLTTIYDEFIVPIDKAKEKFNIFVAKKSINTIPQGYNLSEYQLNNYEPNDPITFAYAGRFYKKLRNPTYFLEALRDVNKPFVFEVYLPEGQSYFRNLFLNYDRKVKGEIILNKFIPRRELIQQLSRYDFLINFDNETEAMKPSKLIDYAIADRPILSFNSQNFKKDIFFSFLDRNYEGQIDIKKKNHDISNIIKLYESLF